MNCRAGAALFVRSARPANREDRLQPGHAGADIATMFTSRRPSPPSTHRASGTPTGLHSRIEVCPPSSRGAWWWRLHGWLRGDAPLVGVAADIVDPVRREFAACIDDAATAQAGTLLMRINTARSLRELWHLRAALYHVVSLQHSQCVAEQRLAQLNRHFPTRSPRSGLMPLDG